MVFGEWVGRGWACGPVHLKDNQKRKILTAA